MRRLSHRDHAQPPRPSIEQLVCSALAQADADKIASTLFWISEKITDGKVNPTVGLLDEGDDDPLIRIMIRVHNAVQEDRTQEAQFIIGRAIAALAQLSDDPIGDDEPLTPADQFVSLKFRALSVVTRAESESLLRAIVTLETTTPERLAECLTLLQGTGAGEQ
jgi:hypothetical protein